MGEPRHATPLPGSSSCASGQTVLSNIDTEAKNLELAYFYTVIALIFGVGVAVGVSLMILMRVY